MRGYLCGGQGLGVDSGFVEGAGEVVAGGWGGPSWQGSGPDLPVPAVGFGVAVPGVGGDEETVDVKGHTCAGEGRDDVMPCSVVVGARAEDVPDGARVDAEDNATIIDHVEVPVVLGGVQTGAVSDGRSADKNQTDSRGERGGTMAESVESGPDRYVDPIGQRIDNLVAALRREVDKVEQLGEALTSRDVIGQAKGILMERFEIVEDEAFAMLQDTSNRTNVKLHDVARRLVRERVINWHS
ncbi:ANTAR domain-containing protein [Arthrobacter sp. Soc17.1.1.1]